MRWPWRQRPFKANLTHRISLHFNDDAIMPEPGDIFHICMHYDLDLVSGKGKSRAIAVRRENGWTGEIEEVKFDYHEDEA